MAQTPRCSKFRAMDGTPNETEAMSKAAMSELEGKLAKYTLMTFRYGGLALGFDALSCDVNAQAEELCPQSVQLSSLFLHPARV